jgi:hypothetical protein
MTRVKISLIQIEFASAYQIQQGNITRMVAIWLQIQACICPRVIQSLILVWANRNQAIRFCSGHFFFDQKVCHAIEIKQNTSNTNEIVHTYFSDHKLPIHAYFDCQNCLKCKFEWTSDAPVRTSPDKSMHQHADTRIYVTSFCLLFVTITSLAYDDVVLVRAWHRRLVLIMTS